MDEHSIKSILNNLLIKLFKLPPKAPENIKQLQTLIAQSENNAILPADVARMIDGVLQVSEIRVVDVMIPYSQMIYLDLNQSITDHLKIISKTAHSRFPVVSGSLDKVKGVLLAKDLLCNCITDNIQDLNIGDLLRPAVFVPENKRLNTILQDFRNKQNHLAIVVDEYGNIVGMVTLEDVLEQIVGDIVDEHDVAENSGISQHSKIRYTAKAQTSIEDFNEYFDSNLSIDNINTIGGFVTHSLGHLPKRNEILTINKFRFRILRADKRQVHLLQVNLIDPNNNSNNN